MQKILVQSFICTLLIAGSSFVSAQKLMLLDNSLKTNSTPMEAKRNFIGSLGRYQFGPYKIVSGKVGAVKGKATSSRVKSNDILTYLFNVYDTEINSETNQKTSFLFTANEKDSVQITTTTNIKEKKTEGLRGENTIINNRNANYIALITPVHDTTGWQLILASRRGDEVKGGFQFDGILSNGTTDIQIRQVRKWENGKFPTFYSVVGYEFYMDNSSIAAVQATPDSFQKKVVWLNQNLNEELKLMLAAASACILAGSENTLNFLAP